MMETEKFLTNNMKAQYIQGLPLVGSPVPVILVLMTYIVFVLKIGPNFMKDRPAYSLKSILIVYNAVQAVVSFFIMSRGIDCLAKYGLFDIKCAWQNDITNVIFVGYIYYLAKLSELLDTVFFVLRKKQNQISFLHVYHHFVMVLLTWTLINYEPSLLFVVAVTVNSFIHVVMYTYYGLAAIPSMRNYLWWKKYLTAMQLIQFTLCSIHAIIYMIVSECPPGKIVFVVTVGNGVVLTYFFSKFYIDSYNSKDSSDIDMGSFVCQKIDKADDYDQIGTSKGDKQT